MTDSDNQVLPPWKVGCGGGGEQRRKRMAGRTLWKVFQSNWLPFVIKIISLSEKISVLISGTVHSGKIPKPLKRTCGSHTKALGI